MKVTWSLVIMGALTAGLFMGCVQVADHEIPESGVTLYYSNLTKSGYVSVVYDLEASVESTEAQIHTILERLKTPSDTPVAYQPSLPSSVRILGLTLNNRHVVLDFSREYLSMASAIEEMICRTAIVKSLTGLDNLDTVEFRVEGLPLKDSTGNMIGAMDYKSMLTTLKDEAYGYDEKELMLYYGDGQGQLVGVAKNIVVDPNVGYEMTILQQLIKGPSDAELVSTIPEGTRAKHAYVKDGICYVDFNEAFVTNHAGGSMGETMTLYAIVNALVERPNIRRVQFMVEGEILESYKGHYDLSVTFDPNWDLVKR